MKANDLMVGDLLRVNSDNTCITKDTIVTVRAIDEDIRQASHIGCAFCSPLDDRQIGEEIWCDYLDPIPLTPEILEKNELLDIAHSEYYVRYDRHDEEWYFIYYGSFAEMKVSITAVHELQHCLKLCGIDKEIVL